MKKMGLILALCLALVLTACGSKELSKEDAWGYFEKIADVSMDGNKLMYDITPAEEDGDRLPESERRDNADKFTKKVDKLQKQLKGYQEDLEGYEDKTASKLRALSNQTKRYLSDLSEVGEKVMDPDFTDIDARSFGDSYSYEEYAIDELDEFEETSADMARSVGSVANKYFESKLPKSYE